MPAGSRRYGNPRSDKERAVRHKELVGGTLPKRGTGQSSTRRERLTQSLKSTKKEKK